MHLSREIRHAPHREKRDRDTKGRILNSWAGESTGHPCSTQWVVRGTVCGDPDPTTGFVCDIREFDELLRRASCFVLNSIMCFTEYPEGALRIAFENLHHALPQGVDLVRFEVHGTPYSHNRVEFREEDVVQLFTRQYEFSAAHRLHAPSFTEEENARTFGKCSNPNGHGHNYVVEISLLRSTTANTEELFPVPELDARVNETVIEPFDHKNLNVEVPEFADLNPSVENIARVIFQRLDAALPESALDNVRVYETPKTWADCARE